jgi:hypothetical protein
MSLVLSIVSIVITSKVVINKVVISIVVVSIFIGRTLQHSTWEASSLARNDLIKIELFAMVKRSSLLQNYNRKCFISLVLDAARL